MSMRCSYAGAVCLWDRNPDGAKEVRFMGSMIGYMQVYGVISAGRGVPERGFDFLKIDKKIEISALLCGPGGEICRIWPFLSFRQVKNCRLGKFLSFRQFWDRRQNGPVKRTDAAFGWESSTRGCVRRWMRKVGDGVGCGVGCGVCCGVCCGVFYLPARQKQKFLQVIHLHRFRGIVNPSWR